MAEDAIAGNCLRTGLRHPLVPRQLPIDVPPQRRGPHGVSRVSDPESSAKRRRRDAPRQRCGCEQVKTASHRHQRFSYDLSHFSLRIAVVICVQSAAFGCSASYSIQILF